MSLGAGPPEELALRGTQGRLLEATWAQCVFVSWGETSRENKDPEPPAGWTTCPRPAPGKSVVCQWGF